MANTKQHAYAEAYRLGNVEARQDIPGGDERSQDGGGNLQIGGDIDAHDAHMGEIIQGQQQEEEEPEKLGCTFTGHCQLINSIKWSVIVVSFTQL